MRAYERLIKYAKIYTTSDSGSGSCPSTERQIDLARILAEDMKAIGISGVRLDKFGYVYGYIPATPGYEGKRSLGLIAHMDTSEAAPGEGVKPILHENYDGNDIYLDFSRITASLFGFDRDCRLSGIDRGNYAAGIHLDMFSLTGAPVKLADLLISHVPHPDLHGLSDCQRDSR